MNVSVRKLKLRFQLPALCLSEHNSVFERDQGDRAIIILGQTGAGDFARHDVVKVDSAVQQGPLPYHARELSGRFTTKP